MIIIRDIDKTCDVVRPVTIERIYGKEPRICAVPELKELAQKLLLSDDPTSDASLSLIWCESAGYLGAIGYADDRFRGRRDIIFAKSEPDGEAKACTDLRGCENLTTVNYIGRECFATVIDGKIVSIAAAYKVEDAYEICVESAPSERGRGYASANVRALSNMLLARGETVRYLCAETNGKSKSVALSAGFFEAGKRYEYIVRRKG